MSEDNDIDVEAARKLLFGVTLDAFLDERKRVVRELRSAKKRAAATEIAKLRKPSAAAWALNRTARAAPGVVEEWLAAGAALREVSADPVGAGAGAVREAIAAHRHATARLMEVVREHGPDERPLSEAMLDRVRALLQWATTDPDAGERLRSAQLSEEAAPAAAGAGAVADVGPQVSDAHARRPTGRGSPAAERKAAERKAAEREREQERARQAADLERRIRDARGEVAAIVAERERREAEAEEADDRVDAARRSLRRAESEADAAHEAVRELERPLRDAERDLERLRAELREASDSKR